MIEWAFTNFCCGANIKDTLISRSGFEGVSFLQKLRMGELW